MPLALTQFKLLYLNFANTLATRRTGILAWYDYYISTGILEGINNTIKTIQRQAYGYRDQNSLNSKYYQCMATSTDLLDEPTKISMSSHLQTQKSPERLRARGSCWKKAATYSPALHCSTIGASGLNFSVRNGKRWDTTAITTWLWVDSCSQAITFT